MLEQEKETMDETGRYPSLALHSRMDHTRLESSKRSRFIEDLNQMNPLPSDPSALFCATNAPWIIHKSDKGTLEQNPHNYGIRPMGLNSPNHHVVAPSLIPSLMSPFQ